MSTSQKLTRVDTPPVPAPAREHFIPLRKAELSETLASSPDLDALDAAAFRRLSARLQALVHCDYQAVLEELKDAYAAFDPDADTRAKAAPAAELDKRQEMLFDRFARLLERGNFVRLAQEEIARALDDCSHWGLNLTLDFEVFAQLAIYYRGDTMGTRYRRHALNRFRTEAVEVPIYQRLVVIFRLRNGLGYTKQLDTEDVYIKLFKDIPKLDLDMLLPGTRVKMSLVDRAKFMLPTVSGGSMAIWKMFIAISTGLYGSIAFLALLGGTLGYGVRSLFGYLNTKQKYQLNLTQSLYYQNLDNNAGAIHRLLDEAEEQEVREMLLAYFFLWRRAPAEGWSDAELDQQIETFLREHAAREVDFEIGDALAKLVRLEIVRRPAGDRWMALPIDEALDSLARHWHARLDNTNDHPTQARAGIV